MRAISLWQPWASAIAAGSKQFETRSWEPPKAQIGQRIAIHAAKRWELEERTEAILLAYKGIDLGFDLSQGPPLGVIVAVATLRSCESASAVYERIGPEEKLLGNFGPGRYAWKLEDVVPVSPPVPCRGQQGFWDLPEQTVTAILCRRPRKGE